MNINKNRAFLAITLSIIGIAAGASSVGSLTEFTSGTPALASEVNANFDAVEIAVDDNDARIAQLEALVATLIAANTVYEIGDTGPAGGIVFHIDHAGKHGLEAAPTDQDGGGGAEWGCYPIELTGDADGTSIGTGAQNTAEILAECGEAGIAAKLADDYIYGGKDDWFLPSKDELNEMYVNLHLNGVGGFASKYYWSSSEYSSNNAWNQYFFNGIQYDNNKGNAERVRAVRVF